LDFIEYLITEDRITRQILTNPGYLTPPTIIETEILSSNSNNYLQLYKDDIIFPFNEMGIGGNTKIMMGFVDPNTCERDWQFNPMPWAAQLYGDESVLGEMIYRIFTGNKTPEEAWEWGVNRLTEIADDWKALHPDWHPADSK
jgi:hypothetical protein